MELNNLTKIYGNKEKSKRRGRGIGSGRGGTSGRGTKGQKARSGGKHLVGFEGGQVPLYKRLPQLGGFTNFAAKEVITLNLSDLNAFENGDIVNAKDLIENKLLEASSKKALVKILANGTLEKKLTLVGFTYSKTAKEALEKAGCELQA